MKSRVNIVVTIFSSLLKGSNLNLMINTAGDFIFSSNETGEEGKYLKVSAKELQRLYEKS